MAVLDQLDPTMTVKDVMEWDARTVPVFQRLGMDTCCAAGLALADAARRVPVELDRVLAELRAALAAA
jgi:hypothetical protein